MIINRNGDILPCFFREDGIVVRDKNFSICLEYDEEQKKQAGEIWELKQLLLDTDYKALKFSDGVLSEEEYAPVRAQRQKWRDEIEETFREPTITREEMDEAEEKAMHNYRIINAATGSI